VQSDIETEALLWRED